MIMRDHNKILRDNPKRKAVISLFFHHELPIKLKNHRKEGNQIKRHILIILTSGTQQKIFIVLCAILRYLHY